MARPIGMNLRHILIGSAVLAVVGAQVWVLSRRMTRGPRQAREPLAAGAIGAANLSSSTGVGPVAHRLHVLTEAELSPVRAAFASRRVIEAPDVPRERQILLCRRLVIAPEERSIPAAASGAQSASVRGTTPFLLQFSVPLSAKLRARLEDTGAELRGYFPNNAMLAELTPAALAAVGKVDGVRFVTEYLPEDKLQPFLAELAETQKDVNAPVAIRVSVQFFTAKDLAAAMPAIEKTGGNILGQSKPDAKVQAIQAELPVSALRTLARLGGVYWIEELADSVPLAPPAQK
jgi:hypothetical protein